MNDLKKSRRNAPEKGAAAKSDVGASKGEAWLTESLRFTAFSVDTKELRLASFEQLENGSAEQIIERPNQNIRQETGKLGAHRFIIQCRAGRADFSLSMKSVSPPPQVNNIGPFQEAMTLLIATIELWFRKAPPLKRLAIAPTLVMPFNSRLDAQKRAKKFLPKLDFDPELDRDFLWQINRPRNSKSISGLIINRVNRWQIFDLQSFSVSEQGLTLGELSSALLQLDLDINTSAENKNQIESSSLSNLVGELSSIASEIMKKGDVR